MNNEMQLDGVELNFIYHKPSGEEVKIEASINSEGIWQQWGGNTSELGDNVSLIESIQEVVSQHLVT